MSEHEIPDAGGCSEPVTGSLLGSYELGTLSGEEKARFEAHLLRCRICFEQLYALSAATERIRSQRLAPAANMDPTADARLDSRARWSRQRRWLALAGAVAAVLILAVAVPWFGDRPSSLRGGSEGAILVYAPRGEVSRPTTLDWAPLEGARSYRVELRNQDDSLLWQTEVAAPPAALPPELSASLEVGRSYFWRVTAEPTASGGEGQSSRRVAFTVVR